AEYWAECVQSWFDTNRENDNDHGRINTREELIANDPRITRLIRRYLGENQWRYQKPHQRKTKCKHLEGFDSGKEKAFEWPDQLVQWKEKFEQGKVSLAPPGSAEIILIDPREAKVLKSNFSRKRCRLYVHNLSEQTIALEWIDFEGKAKQTKTLRNQDHAEINTFTGHVWEIRNVQKDKVVGRFVMPENKSAELNVTDR
ncbi:MAG: hypothetical protein VX821_03290, partial [Verrucomicrobiota bacterium]|nr:hypothetical protein [Verrucomicrobiota bacterium]